MLVVKNPPTMQVIDELRVQPLDEEDLLEKEMAIHSSIFCLENPMDRGAWQTPAHGSQRVRHD